MKKEMVLIAIIMLAVGVTAGFTINQIYTQAQVNSWSEQQIRNNLGFELEQITIDEDNVNFHYGYNDLNPLEIRDYDGFRNGVIITFDRRNLNDCISDLNKSHCFVNVLKPSVVRDVKAKKVIAIDSILDLQTDGDLFTLEDLEGLISDEEVN